MIIERNTTHPNSHIRVGVPRLRSEENKWNRAFFTLIEKRFEAIICKFMNHLFRIHISLQVSQKYRILLHKLVGRLQNVQISRRLQVRRERR